MMVHINEDLKNFLFSYLWCLFNLGFHVFNFENFKAITSLNIALFYSHFLVFQIDMLDPLLFFNLSTFLTIPSLYYSVIHVALFLQLYLCYSIFPLTVLRLFFKPLDFKYK